MLYLGALTVSRVNAWLAAAGHQGRAAVSPQIVIIRKNKTVLDAEICPWSKVDGHSLLSNRVEFNLNPN